MKFSKLITAVLMVIALACMFVLAGCGACGETALQIRNPLAFPQLAPQVAIPPADQMVVGVTAVRPAATIAAPVSFGYSACPAPAPGPAPIVNPEPLFGSRRSYPEK